MNLATRIGALRERALAYWIARTDQERRMLTIGAVVVGLALVYSIFIDPALSGREQLRRSLPQLRQQAAQMQALAAEAQAVAATPAPSVTPMTREGLTASLASRGLTAASLTMTGEYAKMEFKGVSFANLMAWLDAQRRENRVLVQDAAFSAQTALGQVDATLTLRQGSAPPQ
ncbi:general secretion pathway protein GspM [Massilia sp. KIM]|uniref:type II secretion system protein GspM n=1 Tax=Massilia sp. KIM TaxID=1955422 RepID=UPI00098F9049|nr:type II secretion system protein GspM [Massilia sp. KIM]OON60059.1 general secretion pathway protein GspM [Massilia sp. KIM]